MSKLEFEIDIFKTGSFCITPNEELKTKEDISEYIRVVNETAEYIYKSKMKKQENEN